MSVSTNPGTSSGKIKSTNSRNLLLAVGALLMLGILFWSFQQKPVDSVPAESGVVYYTGTRLNRNTGNYVDGSGRIVPPPAGQKKPAPLPKDSNVTKE